MAILKNGEAVKLQAKYATLLNNGVIEVKFRTSWVDKHGTHMRSYKEHDFDYYAIYCPDKEVVLHIPNSTDCPKVVRFNKAADNQTKYVKWADGYREIKRESSETIRHTPEMAKT